MAPNYALIGFYQRATEIVGSHPILRYWDILGLSSVLLSHVYQLSLKSQKVACALYTPRVGSKYKLIFRGDASLKPFDLDLEIANAQQLSVDPSSTKSEPVSAGTLIIDGWMLCLTEVNNDVMVMEPGSYQVFLSENGNEYPLGTLVFAHAPVPDFTADDIAAIKSDPLGVKSARIRIECKLCHDALKAYTGTAKIPELEKDGWQWSQSITEPRFVCTCGKTSFSLLSIRTGFHGLLRRNLAPGAASNQVSTVRSYEKTAIEQSCKDFLTLLNSNSEEEVIQKFLEANAIFFHLFLAQKLVFKPPVLTHYVADFGVLNNRKELLLIEIEKPSLRLLKKDGGVTAVLQHAADQVRSWKRVFDDHRAAALSALDLDLNDVAQVKGVIIAGRKPADESKERVLRSISWPNIELFTYDDILRSVTEMIRQVAAV
jgi:hypothetical protein